MNFDESGCPIPTTDFPFEEIEAEHSSFDPVEWELALIKAALAVVVHPEIRRDAWPSRIGAAAHLLGVDGFATIEQTAIRMGISPRSVKRALSRLRTEINVTLRIEAFRPQNRGLPAKRTRKSA